MKECPICFTQNEDGTKRCSGCDFDFVNGDAKSTISKMMQEAEPKGKNSSVPNGHKMANIVNWADRKTDFVFQTPDIVATYYLLAKAFACAFAILTIFEELNERPSFAQCVVFIIKVALELVAFLVVLRIAYEVIILFFEQLRVTKQIRDMLKEKQDRH